MNYLKIIKYLYSEADADPVSGNFAVTTRPKIGQRTIARPKIENNRAVVDEEGNPIMETVEITGPTDEIETVITKWDLPNPQPTITELEAYSQTQEYQDHLATEEREEQETSTAHERAKNLLKKIQQANLNSVLITLPLPLQAIKLAKHPFHILSYRHLSKPDIIAHNRQISL